MSDDDRWLKFQMMIRPETTQGIAPSSSRFFPRVIDGTVEEASNDMSDHEPLSAERLREIRERVEEAQRIVARQPFIYDDLWTHEARQILAQDAPTLLAEVERLRADRDHWQQAAELMSRNANFAMDNVEKEQAENARYREVVAEVAAGIAVGHPAHCYWCGANYASEDHQPSIRLMDAPHTSNCIVTQARALLGEARE